MAALSFGFAAIAAGPKQGSGHAPSAKEKVAFDRRMKPLHESFVENKGQWNSKALYRAQSQGLNAWIERDGITFDYYKPVRKNGKLRKAGQVVKMNFLGSNGSVSTVGADKGASASRFMTRHGGKPVTANLFGQVMSHDVYPGIDLRSYFDKEKFRYDFMVAPNADPSKIDLGFSGAQNAAVKNGDLVLGTQIGDVAHGKLFAYQLDRGHKVPVAASFKSLGKNQIGFDLGAYDHSKALIIDPVVYGSYIGGDNGFDEVRSIAADAAGNVYITGSTQATEFPITQGPYFTSLKGTQNAYLVVLQGDAYNIDYAVYFGGSNVDYGQWVKVDPFGNIWVAGITTSPDFPGNTKASSPTNQDIFVIRFEKSNSLVLDPLTNPAILMIGGAGQDWVNGFEIVPASNPQPTDPVTLVFAGHADQSTPEVTSGSFAAGDGFLLRYTFQNNTFTPVASSCEYIGDGIQLDMGGLAVDNAGNAYITGDVGDGQTNVDTSTQPGFTTTAGVFAGGRLLQKTDLFIRKYGTTGGLIYSALVGGSGIDTTGGWDFDPEGNYNVAGSAVAVDALGNAYITGDCQSYDYPRTRGVFGQVFQNTQNVVVTKISPDASQILYSTNLQIKGGGQTGSTIIPAGIAVDGAGNAYITGNIDVAQLSFPVPPGNPNEPNGFIQGSVQTGSANPSDPPVSTTYNSPVPPDLPTCEPFLNVLDSTASKLLYGTYLGGLCDDKVFGPYIDNFGDVWVFGWTDSYRGYRLVGSGAPPPLGPIHQDFGQLPAAMITNLAFKAHGDGKENPSQTAGVLFGILNSPFTAPATITLSGAVPDPGPGEARDGYLTKFRIGRPIISAVTVTPSTIPGGLGTTATVNVTLSSAAPPEGAAITLSLNSTAAASFDPNNPVATATVTIPSGATTLATPVTIFTSPVVTNTTALVKASYEGNFLISPLNVIPWLQSLSVTPNAVVGGNTVNATVALAQAAPAGGVTIQIQSSTNQLTLPGTTVTVPAGQQVLTFPIGTAGVDSKSFPQITVSLLGLGKSAIIELDPANILSLVLTPSRVTGGTTVTGTVTLNGLPGPNFPPVPVTVIGNPAGYTPTPANVSFAGTSVGTFTLTTPYEAAQVTRTVQIFRSAVGGTDYTPQTLTTNLIVDVNDLLTFTVDKTTANPGDTVNGTLTISSPADQGGTTVSVTSSDGGQYLSISSPVSIPAASSGVSFPITVNNVPVLSPNVSVTVTASRGPVSRSQTINLVESTLSLSLSSSSVLGGNSLQGTLTLSAAAPVPLTAELYFSPNNVCSLPTAVVIPAGANSVTFTINTTTVTSTVNVSVYASIGAVVSSAQSLQVRASGLASLTFSPDAARGGKTVTGRVTLDGPAPAGGAVITLTSSNSRVAAVPTTVTVPAGQTTYLFSVLVQRVSRPLATTVTASYGSGQVSALLTALR